MMKPMEKKITKIKRLKLTRINELYYTLYSSSKLWKPMRSGVILFTSKIIIIANRKQIIKFLKIIIAIE